MRSVDQIPPDILRVIVSKLSPDDNISQVGRNSIDHSGMISSGHPEYNFIMKQRQTEYKREGSHLSNLNNEFENSVISYGKMPFDPSHNISNNLL